MIRPQHPGDYWRLPDGSLTTEAPEEPSPAPLALPPAPEPTPTTEDPES
jgi:hypothetical protein